ncbi:nitrite reductase (NADH) small subunit [Actinoplanes tereljensis]|uniref:tRNA-(Guanine-N1)-methyltransferase n=1 Tax=Paractinoplanes tereljensis TaxID=571912 RepID=A0A919TYZ3_9ACTN|nr:Rieske (2Fe-2S) protein [Actinoplanes tereljensis]GIF25760.1 tRNA-(guanine-N1)-methyltransferase [Actinoplanes tereljensis]
MKPIGSVHDIPLGEGRTFAIDGRMIAVFRLRDGSVRALSAVCPHKGGPLADGQIDLKQVVCPLHLYAWDLSTGCSLSGQEPVTSFPVRIDDDQLFVEV